MTPASDEIGGRKDHTSAQGRLVLKMFEAWSRLDLDDAMTLVADDVVFLPDLKAAPVVGREAVRSLWARYMGLFAS